MNLYVADTHALYWYLTANSNLSGGAKAAFDEARQGLAVIYLPAITLAELYYLNVKHNRPVDFAAELARLEQSAQFEFVPFEAADTLDFATNAQVSEMHDRIIAGVARRRNAVLLTRDTNIIAAGVVATLW